ncbi:MAG: hypothetical protein JXA13_09275 [Anaerolineales bacterium]|nr:hypothetical protein [Anaerolineales bacterium]
MYQLTDTFKKAYPGAAIGILAVRQVSNPSRHKQLEERKSQLENELRLRFVDFDRPRLKTLPVLDVYARYYKKFKKTYHIQLQLESIVFKNKPIPSVAALVEAMFMAELDNQLLTSGHDLDLVQGPVAMDVATGEEVYTLFNGQDQQLQPNDMIISDEQGILSSIIYGPDKRTRIRSETQSSLFTVYGPAGIESRLIEKHLDDIISYVKLVSPDVQVETRKVFSA